jgi:hypothetical protein
MPGVTAIRSEETDWRLETGNWGKERRASGGAVAVFGVFGDGRRVKLPYGELLCGEWRVPDQPALRMISTVGSRDLAS